MLMTSRLVLVMQYIQIAWFTRNHRHHVLPLSIVTAIYFVTATVYLELFWLFDGTNKYVFDAWYGVGAFECLSVTATSVIWKNIAFRGTPLVERMALLTWIILGEGAIAVAKGCQTIVYSNTFLFSPAVVAQIICATLNLFLLFLIYSHWMDDEEHLGTVRQQIWSFLHFPLHVALVLEVEGASQAITWAAAVTRARELTYHFEEFTDSLDENTDPEDYAEAAESLGEMATSVIHHQLENSGDLNSTLKSFANVEITLNATKAIANGAEDPISASNAFWWLYGTLFNTIFRIAKFDAADDMETIEYTKDFAQRADYKEEAFEDIQDAYSQFLITYLYFFIAAGSVVVFCALLGALSTKQKTPYDRIRLGVTFWIGVGLMMVTAIYIDTAALRAYLTSLWMLPTVTLALWISKSTSTGKHVGEADFDSCHCQQFHADDAAVLHAAEAEHVAENVGTIAKEARMSLSS